MKRPDFIINSAPEGASAGSIRWLSFCFLQDFDFLSHGLIIASKKRSLSSQAKRDMVKRFLEKGSSEEKRVIVPRQVHGNRCVTIKGGSPLKKRCEGDAILTDRRDVLLTVSVADCLPAFLTDPKRKVVGLVHAGWRGTLLGIARQTMKRANTEFGCDPRDFTILLGPAIQKCCYEVSEGIALLFDKDFLVRVPGQRPKLDLLSANLKQFLDCGVEKRKIFASSECTCCSKEMFHSFRRDGDKAGRMIAFLGIK
jgi:YfiH family protein